jgi:hypothetical protein
LDITKEMYDLDRQIHEMVKARPELAERYKELMGEELGRVVILPRVPTPEDWAAAEELARSRR